MPQPDPANTPTANFLPSERDGWSSLSKFTDARIALGRAGGSWRTQTLLDFRLSHAQARDAVLYPFHPEKIEVELARSGFESFRLATAATDRQAFLKRPDLGRQLSSESRQQLEIHRGNWGQRDLAILISDGLSALAAETQSLPLIANLLPILAKAEWTVFPIFVLPFARVKLQDEVGSILQARHALMLLGERPGLGSPDSLGAYLTYQPGPDKTDADRNCVSNIRPSGLPPTKAAETLARLLLESARLRASGVALKTTNPSRQLSNE